MSDEILDGQTALGQALHQARAGEDKQLGQKVRELGEQFVRLTNGLVRLSAIHAPENAAFNEPTAQLVNTLLKLDRLIGQVMIVCVEGQVFVNDVRVRMDDRVSGPQALEAELARHNCGGLSFARPQDNEQVRAMVSCIAGPPGEKNPLVDFAEALRACGVSEVTPMGRFRLRVTGETERAANAVELQRTLQRANAVVAQAWGNLGANRTPNPLPIRRLVNEFIDASKEGDVLQKEEEAGEGLASGEFARHCIRVTTYSILIGRALGFSAGSLADLGVSAMYHDAGYALLDDDGFAPPFLHHGTAGVRILARQRGFHQAKLKRMLAAIEHHRDLDRQPSLYARIIRIGDDFDNYTRLRASGALMSPAEALARMASAVGTAYDPHLFQLFVNTVGTFPPGTLLRLHDGRVVITIGGSRDAARFARPVCKVLRNADGTIPDDATIDLAEPGLQVAEVLLQKR
jgi:hypothetical protein